MFALSDPPRSALGLVDQAVVIGVNLVEAQAKQAIARFCRHRRKAIVIGLAPFEVGPFRRPHTGRGERLREFGLPFGDDAQPKIAIFVKGDQLRCGGLRLSPHAERLPAGAISPRRPAPRWRQPGSIASSGPPSEFMTCSIRTNHDLIWQAFFALRSRRA